MVKVSCEVDVCKYNSDGECSRENISIGETGCCQSYEKPTRVIGYYDLIELPSGRHVPVPLAIKRVGIREVLKIPVSERKRDWTFYYCGKCFEEFCILCDCGSEDGNCYWCDSNPYSFFRCKLHNPIGKYETSSKLTIFEILIKLGYYDFMRYIESSYGMHKGWVEVTTSGEFVRGLFPMGVIEGVEDLYKWED